MAFNRVTPDSIFPARLAITVGVSAAATMRSSMRL